LSFASNIKKELCQLPFENDCCRKAELAAMIKTCGSIHFYGSGRVGIKLDSESGTIIRRIFSNIKFLYKVHPEVMVRKNNQLSKSNIYILNIDYLNGAKEILESLGILKNINDQYVLDYGIDSSIIKNSCCKRAYVRGAFLGGGSISHPEKGYHLEFVTHNEKLAKNLCKLLIKFHIYAKIILRKNNYVVYLKEGEQIVDLLNVIHAHKALLEFENVRIVKDIRNNINRLVNCETANLEKTINASMRQQQSIEAIKDTIGLDELPDNLKEIAELRLEHPDVSLRELGEMLTPPVGKSGVNHRLRKIEKIAGNVYFRKS
jgi:DNA-binding protein WhiA